MFEIWGPRGYVLIGICGTRRDFCLEYVGQGGGCCDWNTKAKGDFCLEYGAQGTCSHWNMGTHEGCFVWNMGGQGGFLIGILGPRSTF